MNETATEQEARATAPSTDPELNLTADGNWHVAESDNRRFENGCEDCVDDFCDEHPVAIHYMSDPGDGLCSTLLKAPKLGDARLIAAAPDLQDALSWLVFRHGQGAKIEDQLWENAKAALKKVTDGEQP